MTDYVSRYELRTGAGHGYTVTALPDGRVQLETTAAGVSVLTGTEAGDLGSAIQKAQNTAWHAERKTRNRV